MSDIVLVAIVGFAGIIGTGILRLGVFGAALSDRHLAADQVADQEWAAVRQGLASPRDPTPR